MIAPSNRRNAQGSAHFSNISKITKVPKMAKSQVLTPEFRLSFYDLFEPKISDMDDSGNKTPRFRIEMLFPKSIKMSELAEMKQVYDEARKPEWLAGQGLEYRKFTQAFINGDTKKQESRKGHWMIRATSGEDYPPRVLLPNRAVARKPDIYSGCYGRAILTAFNWEHKNAKGIVIKRGCSFNLLTFIKTRDGDRLGGFVSEAEQDALLDAVLPRDEAEDLLA